MTAKATPPPTPAPDTPDPAAPRSGLRLRHARYVPLTPEQEREAVTALARLLALAREPDHDQDQHQQDSATTPKP